MYLIAKVENTATKPQTSKGMVKTFTKKHHSSLNCITPWHFHPAGVVHGQAGFSVMIYDEPDAVSQTRLAGNFRNMSSRPHKAVESRWKNFCLHAGRLWRMAGLADIPADRAEKAEGSCDAS